MSINQNQKMSVVNIADLTVMRIQKLNNIVEALKDYLTLPDLSKREKIDLYNQRESLVDVITFLKESRYA
ncbi:MAG: hypothetical protein EVJ46_06450 [Candidatus Acididesulfobacter guangdongensis]|jgi:hypothetical protein|uniref:Uncharacterized protein n=1 Tax=Acididesulfobacter guangdongensis TaxID=2597225 RepID=A0A519BF02_ACIG2|nr:MAG: hypothetical protein EVJ46_06450 [Candidatus Acididesulfobacter guangdongensis]